jgi:hypothetical protein
LHRFCGGGVFCVHVFRSCRAEIIELAADAGGSQSSAAGPRDAVVAKIDENPAVDSHGQSVAHDVELENPAPAWRQPHAKESPGALITHPDLRKITGWSPHKPTEIHVAVTGASIAGYKAHGVSRDRPDVHAGLELHVGL